MTELREILAGLVPNDANGEERPGDDEPYQDARIDHEPDAGTGNVCLAPGSVGRFQCHD
jgi:hypothetical protein